MSRAAAIEDVGVKQDTTALEYRGTATVLLASDK